MQRLKVGKRVFGGQKDGKDLTRMIMGVRWARTAGRPKLRQRG